MAARTTEGLPQGTFLSARVVGIVYKLVVYEVRPFCLPESESRHQREVVRQIRSR